MDREPVNPETVAENNIFGSTKGGFKVTHASKISENGKFVQKKELDMTVEPQQNSEFVKVEIEVLEEEHEEVDPVQSPSELRKKLNIYDEESDSQKQTKHNLTFTQLAWNRWSDLKKSLHIRTHSHMALLLIDCWIERHGDTGCEQTDDDGKKSEDPVNYESKEVKVEINHEDSNESTDVDYEELSHFMKTRNEMENDVCPEENKQVELDDLGEGLNSKYSAGVQCTRESGRKREVKKREASSDLAYDSHGDDDETKLPKQRKVLPKNKKDNKRKKSEVTKKEKKSKLITNTAKKKKAKLDEPKPKAPWIKIQLFEHEDKYQVESMKSFARMNRGNDSVETLFSCLVCNQFKCASRDIIENHIEKHVNKVLDCEACQYVGNSEQDIREHKWTCCKRPKRESVCPLCGHWTASSESRRHHLGKVHGVPCWKCIFCPDMFKTRDERKDHMRSAHEEVCQYCESCKLFKYLLSKEDYQTHLENCSSSVQCQICGLLVKTKSMNKHIQSKHENIRKHQCHRCPYAAKTFRRLKTHLLSHDNIHPFKCKLCTFTCIQSNQLKSHMRTHTGEKPYKCTQCKYAAAWNVQLKEHAKVHSITTAVMCQQCDVAFKNERTLNLHMKKEHSLNM